MTTIESTVALSEVQIGDQWVKVSGSYPMTVDGDLWHLSDSFYVAINLPRSTRVTVRCPDPDDELVEIMAKAHFERDGSIWREGNESSRKDMRAALAALRAAGYTIEKCEVES